MPFAMNQLPGSASAQGAMGEGLERPFDIDFGPDGALYLTDYGVARVNLDKMRAEQPPYDFPPATGTIWKITSTAAQPAPPTATVVTPTQPPGDTVPDMPKTGDSFGLLLSLLVVTLGLTFVGVGWLMRRLTVRVK